jgi:hypothetical protein
VVVVGIEQLTLLLLLLFLACKAELEHGFCDNLLLAGGGVYSQVLMHKSFQLAL